MRKVASNLSIICQRVKTPSAESPGSAFRTARNITTGSSIRQTPTMAPDWAPRDYNFSLAQQIRNYVPKQPSGHRTPTPPCWNCKQSGRENHIRCAACGCLQDLNVEVNFFDLMDFEANYNLEPQELTTRFRKLQTMVHPDKFSNSTTREQTNSADWSSIINKAYKTLSSPIERGQYLLRMNGENMPDSNDSMNKEFLMEMMERNEEVEEARTKERLQELHDKIRDEFNGKCTKLDEIFKLNNLEEAKTMLIKMKYLLSIQTSIKNKLHNMLDG